MNTERIITAEAKVYCHSCGKEFSIHWIGLSRDSINMCPHCGAEIDETMRDSIVDAMAAVMDTNQHSYKYHLERREPLFTVSVLGIYAEGLKPNEEEGV